VLTIEKCSVASAIIITLFLSACSKHADHSNPAPLSVSGINPRHAPGTGHITITGTGFNANIGYDSVFFNGKPAKILSGNDSVMIAVVPVLCGSGAVTVSTSGKIATGPFFNYDTIYQGSTFVDGLHFPFYLVMDTSGNLYVSILGDGTIEKFSPSGALDTTLQLPAFGLAIDNHNTLFAAVESGQVTLLEKIGPGGVITPIASDTGLILGLAVDNAGNLYAGNSTNNSFDKITPNGQVTHIATGLFSPSGVAVASNGVVYGTNYSVNSYANADGALTAIAPNGTVSTFATMDYDADAGLFIDGSNTIFLTVFDQGTAIGWIEKIDPSGVGIQLISPNLKFPVGIVKDNAGNFFVAQEEDAPGATVGSIVKMTPY